MIASKQALSKNNEDDLAGIENRKGDKQLELANLIAKSQVKLEEIKKNQHAEMQQYADTEQLAVDEKKKRLHYERIRITEDREEIRQ